MAKIVVLGLPGEQGLYLVDIDAGTVVPIDPPRSGDLAAANNLRYAGGTVVKGVNFAVAVSSSDKAFSGVFDG